MFRSLFSQSSQNKQRVTVQQWHPQELQQRLAEGDTTLELIDVRTPGEYQYDGHIAGSRLLPLSSLMQRIGELPKDKTIVCICRSGNRSYTACEMLAGQGFEVVNLSGGMIGWKMSGLPHN